MYPRHNNDYSDLVKQDKKYEVGVVSNHSSSILTVQIVYGINNNNYIETSKSVNSGESLRFYMDDSDTK